MVFYRHVCILFLPSPPIRILEFPNRLSYRIGVTLQKRCFWSVVTRLQYARDDEEISFCINMNYDLYIVILVSSKPRDFIIFNQYEMWPMLILRNFNENYLFSDAFSSFLYKKFNTNSVKQVSTMNIVTKISIGVKFKL